MPDRLRRCRECDFRFTGVATHFGEEMCPSCGGIDLEVVPGPSPDEPPAWAEKDPPDDVEG
jgi:rRNA maturation protein Nop10